MVKKLSQVIRYCCDKADMMDLPVLRVKAGPYNNNTSWWTETRGLTTMVAKKSISANKSCNLMTAYITYYLLFQCTVWVYLKTNLGESCRWEAQASHSASTHRPKPRESCAEPRHRMSRSSAGMTHAALPSTDQFQTPSHTAEQTKHQPHSKSQTEFRQKWSTAHSTM